MCTVPDCILAEMQSSVEGEGVATGVCVRVCFQRNLSLSLSIVVLTMKLLLSRDTNCIVILPILRNA